MSSNANLALRRLLRLLRVPGSDASRGRVESLRALERGRLTGWRDVQRLHEAACFLRAYPGEAAEHAAATAILDGFELRSDLRRNRARLEATGIAGTSATYAFHWFTADWLARRCPALLTVHWSWLEAPEKLDELMYPLLLEHEKLAYEGSSRSLSEVVDLLRAPHETDAVFLVRAFRRLALEPLLLEHVYDAIDLPLRLSHGPRAPSITHAVHRVERIHCLAQPGRGPSQPVSRRIARAPLAVREVSAHVGRELIDLARISLVLRGRDLFAFMHANPADVVLADFGGGLQFACIGLLPEHRHLLFGQHVLLSLHNGVPIGYVQACTLFDSAEINFNVFSTFRDANAARVFSCSLALVRHLLGVNAFAINTHQLGEDNPEAIETGAWWFYYKHGFRPAEPRIASLVRRELAAKRSKPTHRSSHATLERLGAWPLFLFLGRPRRAVIGRVETARIGESAVRRAAEVLGGDAHDARCAARGAARRLGLGPRTGWSRREREAWLRWSPLLLALPGVERWSQAEKRALIAIVRAKGGRREADYVLRARRHAKLRAALLALESES